MRCVVFERRIAKEDLFDAVLGEDLESWSCSSCSSTTDDTLETAYNEEVLDEEILQSDIRKLSLRFDNNELNDILAAAAAPPPPHRISGRGTAIVSNTCSWPSKRTTEGPPDAHLAWGALAQRCKLAQPAPPAPNSDNDTPANRSPSASFVHDASSFSTNARASDTFHQRQSMPVKEQRASADVSLPAGEDDSLQLRQRILESFDRVHALGDSDDDERATSATHSPAASACVRDAFSFSTLCTDMGDASASTCNIFRRRQPMPVKEQPASAAMSLFDDDSLQLHQRILASFDRVHALGDSDDDGHDESA